jgi:sigma-B regulation protein RsbU (phosphoserine phosphatase)
MVMGRLRRASYTEAAVSFEPGDRLLLFTDGIPEAPGPGGEMFGEDRLREVLADHAASPAERIAETVVERVSAWTGRRESFDDDLTLVAAGAT